MNLHEDEIQMYFELKGTPESSQESYFRRIKAFIKFFEDRNKSVDEITTADIQKYILYMKNQKGLSPGTINNYISGIKFYLTHVLGKDWDSKRIPRMKRTPSMPVIPPYEEIMLLLNSVKNIKHKAILCLLYGSGLRVSEVAKLKIGDICSKTMRVRVENAKHGTNRYTILSESGLQVLRTYFKTCFNSMSYKRENWLFPGIDGEQHINVKTIKNVMIKLRNQLKLDSRISAHTLRHVFATQLLENRVEPVYIQQMLGHKSLKTTCAYLHMTSKSLMGIKSPLDMNRGEQR
ncbi:MAG: tyrosine-type recombinase/integrase [Clostridiaceae bacterium]|nr:tyrosine-type recombinase/integrase [Clostridiaceae bacterium]